MNDADPTDDERYPTLSEHGRAMLEFLREHPRAPLFRNRSGNRLTAEEVDRVRTVCAEVAEAPIGWKPDAPPSWLADFVTRCFAEVPRYRRLGAVPGRFEDIEPVSRADFSADIAAFVPDSVPLERMINFRTSGTSGHPLLLPSHPVVAASYLAFHMRALRRFGITLQARRGEVGVVLLGMQRKCFTYTSVTPVLDEAGLAKINLHPDDWRDPSDRAAYLDALNPEVIAGDPISFAALLELPLSCRPRAILCTSMTLLPALRAALEARFGCPVLDIYSMNEAGPISVFDAAEGGHVLLQPRMFVEILDAAGNRAAPGTRGEVTLTGGFNCCLPLLRYRTGDFASLDCSGAMPVLRGFSGRPPVRFRDADGEWLNNIEVTHALREVPLPQWTMHQHVDGAVVFRHSGPRGCDAEVARVLRALLGEVPLRVEAATFEDGKVVQYTSDLT
jgi:phenylacetate-CoA ligase